MTQNQIISLVQVLIPLTALISCLRIGFVFLLDDRDKEPETLFYLSLVGMVFSYGILGWFLPSYLFKGENYLIDSPIFIAQILILFITVTLLLADRKPWDKSNAFVRTRVSISLIHLVLFLINPTIGLLACVLVIPTLVLAYAKHEVASVEEVEAHKM